MLFWWPESQIAAGTLASGLHQMWRRSRTAMGELTAGEPSVPPTSGRCHRLGPFISAELFCGSARLCVAHVAGRVAREGMETQEQQSGDSAFWDLGQSVSEVSRPWATTCSRSPSAEPWPGNPVSSRWERTCEETRGRRLHAVIWLTSQHSWNFQDENLEVLWAYRLPSP